jgi:hypothetical protein
MTRTYLYALIRPADAEVDVLGLDGAAVRTVAVGDIAAVVSTVPSDAFDPATVQERMTDLSWLESVARVHDGVVSAAADAATAIPLRLGTTSEDDQKVVELLTDLNAAAHRSFDRLERHVEYGVQVFAVPAKHAGGPSDRSEAGAAFLRRRRAELQQEQARRAGEAAQVDTVFSTLSTLTSASRRNPVRAPAAGDPGTMLLNATFLVDSATAADFRSAVDKIAESFGRDRVVVTGPWAPYSFAELDL